MHVPLAVVGTLCPKREPRRRAGGVRDVLLHTIAYPLLSSMRCYRRVRLRGSHGFAYIL
jgi:hypothetical protein